MKYIAKKILLFAIVTALITQLIGCSNGDSVPVEQELQTIKIGYLPITHALPLFVENELSAKGFKNFKLELVKFGSWTELVEALNSGELDGASMLIQLALKSKQQGIGLKAVALGHRDGNVVVVSNEINSVADLKGKTIAIPSKLSTHNILLYKMLTENGLSYSDVDIIEMPPPEMPAALSEKRLAAYIVAEPFGAQSVANNFGKVLFESQELWADSLCCSLVLRDELIGSKPEIAKEFVEAYVKAGLKSELKDDEVKEIAGKYLKADSKVLDLSLQWISYDNLKIQEEEYETLARYLQETGVLENAPTYQDFIDTTLIDQVK